MMMDSFMCKILVTVAIVCMALQHGCGQPLSERAELQSRRHVRTKRCSCNSWEDKECVYFCHLDIIWVNTPSKLLPYGLGSPASAPRRRRRRSAARCTCADSSDAACGRFCLDSSRSPSTEVRFPPGASVKVKVLASLRSVVRSNMAAAKHLLSTNNNNNMFHVRRPKSRARRWGTG